MSGSPDEDIFDRATAERRVLLSSDTDFGAILVMRQSRRPSVILLRRGTSRRGGPVAALVERILPEASEALDAGAIVVIDSGRVRIRTLPIGG